MTNTNNKLDQLLKKGVAYLNNCSESKLTQKTSPKKWSKKEILGHLIDSGINNLQRFTEIQFENKPYKIRPYKQDDLVKTNDYQNAETKELITFWLSVNNRIQNIVIKQTEKTLLYKIEMGNNEYTDFKFLIEDYVNHLEHHLNQISN